MTRLPPSRFNRKAPATFMKCAVVLIAGALIAASLAYGPTNSCSRLTARPPHNPSRSNSLTTTAISEG
jgi:hypothetical protein